VAIGSIEGGGRTAHGVRALRRSSCSISSSLKMKRSQK
jgi:hypothetical protein